MICGAALTYHEEYSPCFTYLVGVDLWLLFGLYLQLSGHGRWVCLLSGVGFGDGDTYGAIVIFLPMPCAI
jgi:hypothetical protein